MCLKQGGLRKRLKSNRKNHHHTKRVADRVGKKWGIMKKMCTPETTLLILKTNLSFPDHMMPLPPDCDGKQIDLEMYVDNTIIQQYTLPVYECIYQ